MSRKSGIVDCTACSCAAITLLRMRSRDQGIVRLRRPPPSGAHGPHMFSESCKHDEDQASRVVDDPGRHGSNLEHRSPALIEGQFWTTTDGAEYDSQHAGGQIVI